MSVATAGLSQPLPSGFNPALGVIHAASLKAPLTVRWASNEEDLRAVQRLRYQVFADEMGARLSPPPGTLPGLDADRFDPFCDHLMVSAGRDEDDGPPGQLLGTYRVLPPEAARRAGGLYADTEFDLTPLQALRDQAVELGRACVHVDGRSGGVIMTLWTALGRYMATRQLQTMIGCASVSLADGGQGARQLWRGLRQNHLAESSWQVRPRMPLPLASHDAPEVASDATDIPPLIKGYLRCGARLLGPPALDGAFNTADMPLMLRVHEMTPRYRQHFINHHL
jgi:putative hemolysin